MILLRPQAGADPADLVRQACGRGPALLLLVAPGPAPGFYEPFATLAEVLGDELPVVVTHAWAPSAWERVVAGLVDGLRLTPDQARRAAAQTLDEHRVEVLLVDRGQVQGSALTVADRRRGDGLPPALDVKVAAMDLLVAARDAGLTGLGELCVLAREALGMPAGTVGRVRRPARAAAPSAPFAGPVGPPPVPLASVRPAPPPARRDTPAERHALQEGRCTRCGKSGGELEGPCGRPELGRMGVIELE